jgi:hypothetical protein
MKWLLHGRRGFISSHLRSLDGRLEEIQNEVKRLEAFVRNPRPPRQREEVTKARLLGPTILPDSKKRFVSYLSAGSFQTIGLRKHEQKAAKIKGLLIMVAIVLVVFFLVYTFILPLFR